MMMEKQINRKIEHLESVFDSIFDEVLILDKNYKLTNVNKTFCIKYGVTKENAIGKKCYKLTHGLNQICKPPECKCPVEEVIKTGKFSESIHTHYVDGEKTYVELLAYPIINKKGKIKQIVKIGRDITVRKKSEAKIKESEGNLNTILSNVSDSIIMMSKEYKILYMNQKAKEEFGDNIGNLCYKVLMKREKSCENCSFNVLSTNNNKDIRFESKVINPSTNGKKFYEYGCKSGLNINGQPVIIDVIRDITFKKKAEVRLKNSEKKYRTAYNRASFYKDLFTHDINNIFQIIQSSNELLSLYVKDYKIKEKIDTLIDIVKEQIKRGSKLVLNVRRLSEIEEKEMYVTNIEVNEVLQNAIQYVLKCFQSKKINIQTESTERKFYVKANELLLDVFENILINAVRHNTNPIKEILIKISKEYKNGIEYFKLEFLDNGLGIQGKMKEIIFLRAEKTNNMLRGMGLGMSLVKKIIGKFDGKIWVEDKVDGDYTKGSNFIVLIKAAHPTVSKNIKNGITLTAHIQGSEGY